MEITIINIKAPNLTEGTYFSCIQNKFDSVNTNNKGEKLKKKCAIVRRINYLFG